MPNLIESKVLQNAIPYPARIAEGAESPFDSIIACSAFVPRVNNPCSSSTAQEVYTFRQMERLKVNWNRKSYAATLVS